MTDDKAQAEGPYIGRKWVCSNCGTVIEGESFDDIEIL